MNPRYVPLYERSGFLCFLQTVVTTLIFIILRRFFAQTSEFFESVTPFPAAVSMHLCLYGSYTLSVRFFFVVELIFVVLHVGMPKVKKMPEAAVQNARCAVLHKCMMSSTQMGWHTDGLKTNSIGVTVCCMRFGVCGVSFSRASVNV